MVRLLPFFLVACAHSTPSPTSIPCRVIPALPGPEDLVYVTRNHRWLGSFAERRRASIALTGLFSLQGEVLNSLPIRATSALLPVSVHGIDWLESSGHLFVVDHVSPRSHRILKMAFEGEALRVEAEMTSPLLSSANDVVAVAEDEFYVTVDLGSSGTFGKIWEGLTARRWGGVVHYRKGQWRWVAKSIAFANGIEVSADQRSLFVAAYRQGQILRYDRDLQTGDLSGRQSYARVPGYPDNLSWSENGEELIVASHDSLWDLFGHLRNPANHAGGGVYRILSTGQVEPIFWDDGRRIDAPSIALKSRNSLLIGQVFDSELLRCTQFDSR